MRRVDKISKVIDDIIAHQEHERGREQEYKNKLIDLASSFTNLVFVQMFIAISAAGYAVVNLRKFFVKKHIFWIDRYKEYYGSFINIKVSLLIFSIV